MRGRGGTPWVRRANMRRAAALGAARGERGQKRVSGNRGRTQAVRVGRTAGREYKQQRGNSRGAGESKRPRAWRVSRVRGPNHLPGGRRGKGCGAQERSEAARLTETMQVGADCTAVRGIGMACAPGIIPDMLSICAQQAMPAAWAPIAMPPSATGSRACAQAGAAWDAPAQRTLTKATADAGRSDCISNRKMQSSRPN